MELEHSYIETNGIRLHVVQAGPKSGIPVVLLHGFPEFWYGWRKQIPALAKAGCHIIEPDQRGYNLSDKPKGGSVAHRSMAPVPSRVAVFGDAIECVLTHISAALRSTRQRP